MWLIYGVVLLSLGTNLDNLGVGLAYGAGGIRLPVLSNLVIALIATGVTAAAMVVGQAASHLLAIQAANALGGLLLIAAGLWIGAKSLVGTTKPVGHQPVEIGHFRIPLLGVAVRILREPSQADQNRSGLIDLAEAIPLGQALAANNVAGGLGGGLTGFPPLATSVAVGLGSFLTLWGGRHIGRRTARPGLGTRAALLAAVLLILVGLHEV
ncbi:MAG: sporulation membrane protein YtaF [Bacillota bacterium]